MKTSTWKRMSLTLLCSALGLGPVSLTACAARQEFKTPAESKVLKENAVRFALALLQQDRQSVLQYSDYPFYLNHTALIQNAEEWEGILRQVNQHTQSSNVQIRSLMPYSAERLRNEKGSLWAQFLSFGLEDKDYFLIEYQVDENPAEQVLLILDPYSARVCGFVR